MPGTVEEEAASAPGRLLLLSNRLPITIKRADDGTYSFSMSSGGLVTGLSGLSKTTSFQWYGWPGLEVPATEVAGMKQRLKDEYDAHPVFIDDDLADRHYNGFASVSHSLPPLTRFCSANSVHRPQTRFSGHSSTTTLAR
jgi:trehalose 6-phosphate synthase